MSLEAQVRQLERTVKASMQSLPPGEHLHVASIIFEQNAKIVLLKRRIKKLTANAPADQKAGGR
jgi:hypothetical protein